MNSYETPSGPVVVYDYIPKNNRKALISKRGVLRFDTYSGRIFVNGVDLIEELNRMVLEMNPEVDHDGSMAAEVTLEVLLIGDIKKSDTNEDEG